MCFLLRENARNLNITLLKTVQTSQISFNLTKEQLTLTLLSDEPPFNPQFEQPWFLRTMLTNQSLKA